MIRSALAPASSPAEELARRRLARINPYVFACYVDPHYAVPYSYPHAKLIFDYFRRAEAGDLWQGQSGHGAKILIVTLPPNHLKSSILNKCIAWYLGKRSTAGQPHQIALVSYGADLAETNSKTILNTIQEPNYKNVFPTVVLSHPSPSPKKWSLDDQANGDTCKAVGIGGALTGHRAHLLAIDDPIKSPADAASASARKGRRDWWLNVAATRLTQESFVVLILTRWREDDLAGWLLAEAADHPNTYQIELLRIPAIAETQKDREAAGKMGLTIDKADPIGREAGEALCPQIKTLDQHLARRRLAPAEFASLDQGLPRRQGGYLIGRDNFTVITVPPAQGKISWAWCVDFAYTEKEATPKRKSDPDFTALGKIGIWRPAGTGKDEARIIIGQIVRKQLKMNDAKEMIKRTILNDSGRWPVVAFAQNIDKIGMQSLMSDPDLFGYSMKLIKPPKGDKVARAQPWIDRAANGLVFALAGAWLEDFLLEAESFPRGAHDDQIDMVTVGFYYHGLARKQAGSRLKPRGFY